MLIKKLHSKEAFFYDLLGSSRLLREETQRSGSCLA
jgi:hypothetical protein